MVTGIVKNQRNISPSKEYTEASVSDPTEMEIQEAPNKKFKIIFLQMFRELEENMDK